MLAVKVPARARDFAGIDAAITPPALCLLYTSDAADERSSVDLGGRRIIKKKNSEDDITLPPLTYTHRMPMTRRETASVIT